MDGERGGASGGVGVAFGADADRSDPRAENRGCDRGEDSEQREAERTGLQRCGPFFKTVVEIGPLDRLADDFSTDNEVDIDDHVHKDRIDRGEQA